MKKAKKNSVRGGISVRGDTYARIKGYCERQQVSVSDFTEELALEYLRRQKDVKLPAPEKRGVAVVREAPHPDDVKW